MLFVLLSVLGWGGAAGALAGIISKRANVTSLMFWGPFISLPLAFIPLLLGASLDQPKEVFLFVFLSYLFLRLVFLLARS